MSDEIEGIPVEAIAQIVKTLKDLKPDMTLLRRHMIKSMGIDYAAYDLPDEVWEFLTPKLFKLYYRVSQGDKVTQGDVNKLIRRELKKLLKSQSNGGRDE